MSKHSKKVEDILSNGKELFWKYGIKRVSIEEICENSRVSKMTFYKHFRNKNDLVREIMGRMLDESTEKFEEIIGSDSHYSEKAKEMLILKMEGTENLSKEFMADYYSLNDPELLTFLNNRTRQVLDMFLKSITQAQEKGEVRKEIKPEFMIYFFNHIQTMANDPQLMTLYPTAQELIMELLNFLFYGIIEDSSDNGK